MRSLSFGFALTACVLAVPVLAQQPAPAKRTSVPCSDLGLDPDRIAAAFAPVLWLSEDEKFYPVRLPNECEDEEHEADSPYQYTKEPRALPPEKDRATGYYYIKNRPRPNLSDTAMAKALQRLEVRYWFYYPNEHGYHAHEHDLERVDIVIERFEEPNTGRCHARVVSMVGAAHGSRWFENQLIDAEVAFPSMILVEEGKHATCPDRTGDGRFTPGDDINRSVGNAWGIRDILGSGFMGTSPRYSGHMTKTRREALTLVPENKLVIEAFEARFNRSVEPKDTYDLIAAEKFEGVDCNPAGVVNVMRRRILNKQGKVPFLSAAIDPILPVDPIDTLGARWDQSRTLGTFNYPLGYVVARHLNLSLPGEFNVVLHYDFDADQVGPNIMYTPTIAYWWTWYAMFGLDPESVAVDDREAMELGFRLRVPTLKERWTHRAGFLAGLLNQLVPEFVGARLGVRVNDFDSIRNERLVLEFGSGIW